MSLRATQVPAEITRAVERGVLDPVRGVDRLIAVLAGVQHGVVARAQLLQLGATSDAIAIRLRAGRLHRIHRGVYLVGHRATPPLAPEMAAVLACGPAAVVSHRSAAVMSSLLRIAKPDPVEVTVAMAWSRERPGICVHRTNSLEPQDVRRLEGITVTSPARTLLDLAAVIPTPALERIVAEAEVRRLVRRSELRSLLDRNKGRPGTPALLALLDEEDGPALTRSAAEERLLGLVRAARLQVPETNAGIGGYEVDFLWRRAALIVEVDGYRFHSTRRAFEQDRDRDAHLAGLGFIVIRVTWWQLVDEPEAVVAKIAAALARASS